MKELALISGSIFGILAIILGAFGAHAFKKILSPERIASFEVGVRYQMYSALALLLIGFHVDFTTYTERLSVYGILFGTILFSFSIYFLSFSEYWNRNLKFLGPITPLGGLLMIIGWVSLLISFLP